VATRRARRQDRKVIRVVNLSLSIMGTNVIMTTHDMHWPGRMNGTATIKLTGYQAAGGPGSPRVTAGCAVPCAS